MLDDFAGVLEAVGPIDLLVGASLGGVLALGAGRRHPIPKVVAVDPFFHSRRGDWGVRQLAGVRELQALSKPERDAEMKRRNPGIDPQVLRSRVRAIDTLSYPWLERFIGENRVDEAGWDHGAELENYPRPLFVMIAGVESIIPAEDLETLEERAGPNLCSKTFAGHGHALHRSAFDEFAALIEEWMA
jgi:pimeloyl-ACP methyl ester carboxylesterase